MKGAPRDMQMGSHLLAFKFIVLMILISERNVPDGPRTSARGTSTVPWFEPSVDVVLAASLMTLGGYRMRKAEMRT